MDLWTCGLWTVGCGTRLGERCGTRILQCYLGLWEIDVANARYADSLISLSLTTVCDSHDDTTSQCDEPR